MIEASYRTLIAAALVATVDTADLTQVIGVVRDYFDDLARDCGEEEWRSLYREAEFTLSEVLDAWKAEIGD